MRENDANLSAAARAELEEEYAGTRLCRQELSEELREDVEQDRYTPTQAMKRAPGGCC
ncbi:hypothetical protein [Streptomyces roseochromogenus]|nr:hypothetical protein [Streptomyces roseochromogenus]